jgi:hypothetical protein
VGNRIPIRINTIAPIPKPFEISRFGETATVIIICIAHKCVKCGKKYV